MYTKTYNYFIRSDFRPIFSPYEWIFPWFGKLVRQTGQFLLLLWLLFFDNRAKGIFYVSYGAQCIPRICRNVHIFF